MPPHIQPEEDMIKNCRRNLVVVVALSIAGLGVHYSAAEAHAGGHSFVVRFVKTAQSATVWTGPGFVGGTAVDVRATILAAPIPVPPNLLSIPSFKFEVLEKGTTNVLRTAILSGVANFAPGGGNQLTAQIALNGTVQGSNGSRALLRARSFNGLMSVSGIVLFQY